MDSQIGEVAEFHFDPATHRYTFNGRLIPSVTGLLKDAGILKFGGQGTELENEVTMSRGRAAHAACEYLDQGRLDPATVADEVMPYLMAYEKFKAERGFKPRRIEEPLFSPTFMFAGTLDREGVIGKEAWLIDLKTGKAEPHHGLQLAGYDLLLPTLTRPRRRAVLELHNDGSYRIEEYTGRRDRDVFQSILAVYWWKMNNGKGS